jgi:hypothetical protein
MLSTLKHLLPRALSWTITVDKQLRQLFVGFSEVFVDVREYFDLIWLDMFPETTRELTAWEQAFGVNRGSLVESERRNRLSALWSAQGGQDPRYIQDTLQLSGFDVYVHEWWQLPLTVPPVPRNPYTALGTEQYGCGDPEMECGEPAAECGNYRASPGYMLVNKLYTAEINYTCECGERFMECGEPTAECGENSGFTFRRIQYPIPDNPAFWPYIMYIGGEIFGDTVIIDSKRQDEFENLCLKICPTHLWIGLLINFTDFLVEDESEDTLVEDESGYFLLE